MAPFDRSQMTDYQSATAQSALCIASCGKYLSALLKLHVFHKPNGFHDANVFTNVV